MSMNLLVRKERRANRTRRNLRRQVDTGRLRLSVFRSAKHIYAQVIDDRTGRTLAEANSKALAPSRPRPSAPRWPNVPSLPGSSK